MYQNDIIDNRLFEVSASSLSVLWPQQHLCKKSGYVRWSYCVLHHCRFLRHSVLEYATSFWSPYFNYAIDKIKSVQRKFTKRLKGCKYLDYPTRLSFLNLPSLERRRLTADLILTYKIIFGLLNIRMEDYFQIQSTNDDRTQYKLFVNFCRTKVQKKFFNERVVKVWNLSLIHIWRCRRSYACRSRWSPYH